jgi:hypothetical protein
MCLIFFPVKYRKAESGRKIHLCLKLEFCVIYYFLFIFREVTVLSSDWDNCLWRDENCTTHRNVHRIFASIAKSCVLIFQYCLLNIFLYIQNKVYEGNRSNCTCQKINYLRRHDFGDISCCYPNFGSISRIPENYRTWISTDALH